MTIPVVQGTAVPSGGQYDYAQSTPYVVAEEGDYQQSFKNENEESASQKKFQDVPWAILFIGHLIAMIAIISMNIAGMEGGNGGSAYNGVIWMVGLTAVISIFVSCASLSLMMKYPQTIVKTALVFSVGMSLVMAILGFMTGQIWFGVMGLVMFAIGVCYAKMVWERIAFAAANLNTALTAVKSNMGLTFIAVVMLIVALGWSILWFVGLGEAVSTSSGAIVFLLLVSYYWVHQVLCNVVHVTSAGTVATWWYVPLEAASCWSTAIQDSFCRATSYSFGSICFGSLLVAIVQALRAMAQIARQNDDMQILACLLDCILSMIQGIIEYLNTWAYVYVGVYGYPYLEAGRNVIQLFQNKGWSVIITDDLCDRVLFMVSLGVGFLTGIVGWAAAATNQNLLAGLDLGDGTGLGGFVIGLIVGFAFSSILLSVVGSAVNTVIVCYAEAPREFEINHPQLSSEMRAAWMQAWPGLTIG